MPISYNAVLYQDGEGKVQGVFAAARDITDIRKYQNLLSQSLSFYLNILDKFPNPIWRSGVDAKCDYFNKAWLVFTGRPLEEELGDGWVSGVHPEDLDRCVTYYLKSFEERESFCMMYRLHHVDGTFHWFSTNSILKPYTSTPTQLAQSVSAEFFFGEEIDSVATDPFYTHINVGSY